MRLGPLIPLLAIGLALTGWIIIAVVGIISRTRVRELEIKERIAMIEKGLVPPPEKDPEAFDRVMGRYDRYAGRSHARRRSLGIILMGLGFGLMLLIGINDEVRHGIGVGGFLLMLGLAFFVVSWLDRPSTPKELPGVQQPTEPPPSTLRQ